MAGIDKKKLQQDIAKASKAGTFNIYRFAETYAPPAP
jgi:hypothetical protein